MDPMQFLDILDSSLSEAELSALCRQFGVAFGAFPGADKRAKAREFLAYVGREGRTASLAEAVVALRPDLAADVAGLFESKEQELAWLDQIAAGEGRAMDSGLTWRWASSVSSSTSGSSSAAGATPAETPPAADDAPTPVEVPNPYTPGLKVIRDAMFFGRATERDQLQQQIAGGEHVAIISGRGFGASSLLYHAANHYAVSTRLLSAYVDMKDPTHNTLSGMLNAAWRQWWGRVKPGNAAVMRTLPDFATAVRKLNAAGLRPLLFLDELEQLVWRPSVFGNDLFNTWYELARDGQIGFALTGHASPGDLLVQNGFDSPFHELFQQLNPGLLDIPAARDMLTLPARRAGLEMPDGAVDYFLTRAGPHPFFLQLAGHYLYDALARRSYSRAEVNERFTTAAEPFWQELWDSMTPLAQENYPVNSVTAVDGMAGRQLRILANKGLAIADETGIRPFSAGFADWLGRMRAATEAVELAAANLAAMR